MEIVERAIAGETRSVYLLGESMGAGVALAVGRKVQDALAGLVLVSPATTWYKTPLGGARKWLITLPEPVLAFIIALSSFQLLDAGQIETTVKRIATGERLCRNQLKKHSCF